MQPPDLFARFRLRMAETQQQLPSNQRWRCRAMGWTFYFDDDEAPNALQRFLMRILMGAQFKRR